MSQDVARRVRLPVALGSLLLLGLGVSAAWYTSWLNQNVTALLDQSIARMRAAEELDVEAREVRTCVNSYLITQEPRWLEEASALAAKMDPWLERSEQLADTPRGEALMRQIRRGRERFFQELELLKGRRTVGDVSSEIRRLNEEVLTGEVIVPAHRYLQLTEEETEVRNTENCRVADLVSYGMLALAVGGAVGGLLGGMGLSRALRRSLIQLQVPIRDVAGHLNQVVGPVQVTLGENLGGLEGVLHALSHQVEAVVGRLQQQQQQVLRSEQLARVGQLAAGLGHELLNPLMSIRLLAEGNLEEARARGLPAADMQIISEQTQRLERSLRRFLDFARPPRLERQLTPLDRVIEQVLALLRGRAQQQGVTLAIKPAGQPVEAEVDAQQIEQLLINLGLNALDAMPAGGRLEIVPMPPMDGWVELRVQDSGPGLSPAILPRLFEPFASTKETGMGLGLAISRHIAESHGGTLTASNQPEGGTCFLLRLPAPGRDLAPARTTDGEGR